MGIALHPFIGFLKNLNISSSIGEMYDFSGKVFLKMEKFQMYYDYLKLNFKYPEFSIGFRWVLRTIYGYTFDAGVTKMIEDSLYKLAIIMLLLVYLNYYIYN